MASDAESNHSAAAPGSADEENTPVLRRSSRARAPRVSEAAPLKPVKKPTQPKKKKSTAEPVVEEPESNEEGSDNGIISSEEDSDKASSEESGESSAEEEPRPSARRKSTANTPQKKTATPRKAANGGKTTATPKKRAPKKPAVVSDDASLFDIVMDHSDAIEAQISDWVAEYTENKVAAMVDLVNFLIKSSGCAETIDASMFEDHDNIAKQLSDFQGGIEATKQQDYPIIAKGRGRGGNKFRKNIAEFWSKWVSRLRHGILFEDHGWCFEALIVWLVAMSSSVFRPFRHTATTAALALMSGFCDIGKQNHNEWTIANRQLGTEQKKEKSSRKTKQLEERAEALHEKKIKLETCMNDLFDSVFVHRYRDTDPAIRTECIAELGIWIQKFPDAFLDPSYLRYIGWMLSDKSAAVRLESLKALCRLYAIESLLTGLRAFTERFRPRFLQMALAEKEVGVQAEALNLVTLVAAAGLLEDADHDALMPLIFSDDVKIRGLVAKLVEEVWREEHVQAKTDELQATLSEFDRAVMKQQWIDTKCLCEMLVQFAKFLPDQRMHEAAGPPAPPTTNPSVEALSASASQSQQSLFAPDFNSLSMGEEDPDADLDDEALTERAEMLKEREQFVAWVVKDDVTADGAVGYGQVEAAVSALWTHVAILRDWQSMSEYLSFDMTSLAGESDSQEGEASRAMRPTDDEETCLLYVINAAIKVQLAKEKERAAESKKSAKSLAEAENVRSEVSRGLIKFLPKLVSRYSHEYAGPGQRRAAEIAILMRHLDVGMYREMRMMKAYETLFDDVKRMFLKHSDRDVLTECARTLRYLTGIESPDALDGDNSAAGDDMAATSLHAASMSKFEELAEEVVGTQISTALKQMQVMGETEGVQMDPDLAFTLRNALRRLTHLETVLDLGQLDEILKTGDEEVQWKSLFELLHEVLNVALTAVSKGRVAAEEGAESSVLGACGEVLDEIIEISLTVMCSDVTWTLRKYVQATQEGAGRSDEAKSPAPAGGDDAMDVDSPPAAKDAAHKKLHATDLIELYVDRNERLAQIAEAILASSEEELIEFNVGVKFTAFQVLMYVYMMSNGDVAAVHPGAARPPPADVQSSSVELIGRVIAAVAYRGRESPRVEGNEATPSRIDSLTPEQLEDVRTQLAKLVGSLGKLVISGLYEERHIALMMQYYGIRDDVLLAAQPHPPGPLLPPFGTIWDGIADAAMGVVFAQGMVAATRAVTDEASKEKTQSRLKVFKATVTGLTDILFDGLFQSTELYHANKVESIDPALNLAKAMISNIKTWLPAVKATPALKVTHGIVVESLLALLRRGGDEMVQRVQRWCAVHGTAEDAVLDDMGFVRAGDVRGTLHETNQAWRVWGAVGGVVQQAVHDLGMLSRQEDDEVEGDRIDNVEDVVEHVSRALRAGGHKPAETDVEWAGYWAFVKALQKGDSTVRKLARKTKASVSRDASPAPGGTKKKRARASSKPSRESSVSRVRQPRAKKARRTANDVADDDEGEEEDHAEVAAATPVSRRRSSRAAVTSARKVYREVDDEDEDEEEEDEEPETPVRKQATPKARKSASKRPVAKEDEEEEEAEEEEQEQANGSENGSEPSTPVAKKPRGRATTTPQSTPRATYKGRNRASSAKAATNANESDGEREDDEGQKIADEVDESEGEEVTPKKSQAKSKAKPAVTKKKPAAKKAPASAKKKSGTAAKPKPSETPVQSSSKALLEALGGADDSDDNDEVLDDTQKPVQSTVAPSTPPPKRPSARAARGTKRGRAAAASMSPPPQEVSSPGIFGSESPAGDVDKENATSEDVGFVSSPDVVAPKKRVRV
ncbi:hypothetical protein HDU87_002267 [Geranomyces variabilis]|uniref:SCD domain-containing protein n=1 Tax=Geranomyces variabilis TaxID=109894 RepID=A0AAD5XS52_9FUNG|nr:hypothetical protein HDU87_002267 [Geranomyces variabilis]